MNDSIVKITNVAPAPGRRTHYCTAGDHKRKARAVVCIHYRNHGDNPSIDPRRMHSCERHAREMVQWFRGSSEMLETALAEGKVQR